MVKLMSHISVRTIVTNSIRLLLIIAVIFAFTNERKLVLAFSAIALVATFIPALFKKAGVDTGVEAQIILLIIIYGSLYLGEVRTFYEGIWWGIILKSVGAMTLSFIGLTVIVTMENEEILDSSPFILILLSFSVSFMLGAMWEIIEFLLDQVFIFNLQSLGTGSTAQDLLINSITALVISVGGYVYMRKGGRNLVSNFVVKVMQANPRVFRSRKYLETPSERIKSIITNGEGSKLEFKSSLRTNLHTNAFDKNIEFSILKTITAYLNTEGGTLIVGVSDKGEILGLGRDAFPSNDKLKLHLENMIKDHIGPQFKTFIDYGIFSVDDKHILKIDCLPSIKRIFLKQNGDEEFYIRNGPSTAKLSGNALLDYVAHRFR